jgi:hypothetical protein
MTPTESAPPDQPVAAPRWYRLIDTAMYATVTSTALLGAATVLSHFG